MSWWGAVARRRRRLAAGLVQRAWRYAERAGTITADTVAGRRFAAFGPRSLMAFPPGSVYGEQWIVVGDATMIGAQVTLCAGMAPGHDLGPDPVLRLGSRCVIGRGSHLVAHHSIDIGDDVFTGPYVYITDQNHSYTDPDTPIGRQWPVNAPVRIGAGSWLGTGAVILPGADIGANVVVAAGAVVRGKVPDRCVVAGVPARVIREHVPGLGWVPRADLSDAGVADSTLADPGASDSTPADLGASDSTPADLGASDSTPADPGVPGSAAGPARPLGAETAGSAAAADTA